MRSTGELLELDRRHVWHPFTAQEEWEAEPQLVIRSAEDFHLVDTDGNRYIDGVSSLWVGVFGHRVPEIDAAVREQLGRVAHSTLLGLANEPSIELAERLAAFVPPPLRRVFYSDNGSTAVEVAVKMAYQFCRQNGREKRTKFVAFSDAYHGDTLGSVSLGGIDLFHGAYRPLLFGVHRAPYPHCYRCPLGEAGDPCRCGMRCAREFEQLLERHGHEIAGCVIEPLVQGAAGMAMYHPVYLKRARELCTRYGVHLIADEIAVGMGRSGTLFACEQANIRPDFLLLSKGITGGYLPLSVVMTTDDIYQAFYADETARGFLHSHSYTGNPLACRAALATLDIFAQDDVLNVNRNKAAFLNRIAEPLRAHPRVRNFRNTGMVWAFEVESSHADFAQRCFSLGLRQELLLRPMGNTVYFMPPYVITEEEMQLMVARTLAVIEALP